MVSCADADIYLNGARANFDQALADVLADIKSQLYPSASFAIETPGLFFYNKYGYPTTISTESCRLTEFDPFIFEATFGRGVAGTYNLPTGRIFVKETKWCRHSLIHETLHSVSTFAEANNWRRGMSYLFINEGLTDLLASFISWKLHNDCYVTWKNRPALVKCIPSSGYNKMARIWYTFCRFMPFNSIVELYFNDKKLSWTDQWANFLNEIAEAGYTFNDPLSQRSQVILEDRFLFECKKSFGENEVERIYEEDSYDFDYDKLIII